MSIAPLLIGKIRVIENPNLMLLGLKAFANAWADIFAKFDFIVAPCAQWGSFLILCILSTARFNLKG